MFRCRKLAVFVLIASLGGLASFSAAGAGSATTFDVSQDRVLCDTAGGTVSFPTGLRSVARPRRRR